MFFRSPVCGRAILDQPQHYEFKLHNANLSFDIPAGAPGIPDHGRKVVNYLQKPEKFKPDGNSGREYYRLHGAFWPYYKNKIFFNDKFPVEIGELSYNIGVNKLSNDDIGSTSIEKLEKFIWKFLENFLDGPEGLNTRTRKFAPGESDEDLASVLLFKPKNLDRINFQRNWISFKLGELTQRNPTIYYFTPLNDEFAISIEFKPSNRTDNKKARQLIDDMHEKTIQMIMNSIQITFD